MKRLDQWLVEHGHFPSRERARLAIMAGQIEIEGKGTGLKAGTRLRSADRVIIREKPRFVSRGGDKLDGALRRWRLDVSGKTALDVGASTGGFSQCLLDRGISRLICLDVGKGQLHWDLRRDPRVTVMEGVNIRYLDPFDLPFRPLIITADVSFISLRLVFPVLARILESGGDLLALIKPQFEAGKGKVGNKGVVRDPDMHREVLKDVLKAAGNEGFRLVDVAPSELRGANGNIEFFAWFDRVEDREPLEVEDKVGEVVREAWEMM